MVRNDLTTESAEDAESEKREMNNSDASDAPYKGLIITTYLSSFKGSESASATAFKLLEFLAIIA
jgi:hypothetical protein